MASTNFQGETIPAISKDSATHQVAFATLAEPKLKPLMQKIRCAFRTMNSEIYIYPSNILNREAIREPMAEFIGVAIFVIFGAGADCQVGLSRNVNVSSSPKGVRHFLLCAGLMPSDTHSIPCGLITWLNRNIFQPTMVGQSVRFTVVFTDGSAIKYIAFSTLSFHRSSNGCVDKRRHFWRAC